MALLLRLFRVVEGLSANIMQLFIGGFDTTTTTLTWALLFLINNLSDQQKLYEEVNQVIGESSSFTRIRIICFSEMRNGEVQSSQTEPIEQELPPSGFLALLRFYWSVI